MLKESGRIVRIINGDRAEILETPALLIEQQVALATKPIAILRILLSVYFF